MSTPEWRSVLESQLKQHAKSSAYSWATASPKPHVRYLIHREFSPSHLLLTTTDRRMAKTRQHEKGAAIAWLFPSMVQVRLEGRAILYPSPIPFPDPPKTTAKEDADAVAATFAKDTPEADPQWWEQKRKDLWNGLSPDLRASFSRPQPGAELKDDPDNWIDELPADDKELSDEKLKEAYKKAWENFAVLALEPEYVEVLDLGSKPHKRTLWESATKEPKKKPLNP